MRDSWVRSLGWEDSPRGGNGNPLQYSCLEKSQGQRSLVGYNPWCHKESDTTERLHFHFSHWFKIHGLKLQLLLYQPNMISCFLPITVIWFSYEARKHHVPTLNLPYNSGTSGIFGELCKYRPLRVMFVRENEEDPWGRFTGKWVK